MTSDNDVLIELKLHILNRLHKKGYLSDEMCANATELVLEDYDALQHEKQTKLVNL